MYNKIKNTIIVIMLFSSLYAGSIEKKSSSPVTNIINSIHTSSNGNSLQLRMNGKFNENSHFSFFLDTDNNPNTGYNGSNKEIRGADYLVQEMKHKNTVEEAIWYKYPEGAHGWKWEEVARDPGFTSSSIEASTHIPLFLFSSVSEPKTGHARFIAQISTSNWSQNTYTKWQEYHLSSDINIINSTKVSSDNENLIVSIKGSFINKSHFELFINSDNNKKTGHKKTNGTEYLVQNHTLFVYSGDGDSWDWTKIAKIESYSSAISWDAKVPLSLLHLDQNNHIKYISRVLTLNWKTETYGSIKSYVLSNSSYVVAKNGNDNAIGDESHPFQTIQNAINHAQAGDTVYVKAGTYYEKLEFKQSGQKNLPIILQGEKDSSGKRLVTIFGGDRVTADWTIADEISPYVYKTTDIPYHSFAMTVKRDGEIKDIPKLYAQDNEAFFTHRKYNYKEVLAYSPDRTEQGPFTHLEVNYWDGIEALYAYEPSTHTTYIRFRDGENPNSMELYSSEGGDTFSGKDFNPSHQGAAIKIANQSYITIKGFNIDGAQDGVLIYGKNATHNIIEDNEITNGQRRVLLAEDTSNNLIRNNKMHMRLLSKKYRPRAWLSQRRYEINDNYNEEDIKNIVVAEHYYNVYKHEVGAATGSPQDDCGINFIYAGNGNKIYKNEIYDTLGGVFGNLAAGKKIYIYDNIFHHISSVTTHIPEIDLGEYFIHGNKMYDVQIGIRIQLMLDYDHRELIAKKVHFYNNIIYNPQYLGVNLYVYRTNDDYDYQNETQYHPDLEFKNNKFIGGRIVLGLKTNIGSKTDLIGNTFSNVKMEIEENQNFGIVKNNWVNTIAPSEYIFNNENTMSDTPKWNVPKIPKGVPNF